MYHGLNFIEIALVLSLTVFFMHQAVTPWLKVKVSNVKKKFNHNDPNALLSETIKVMFSKEPVELKFWEKSITSGANIAMVVAFIAAFI